MEQWAFFFDIDGTLWDEDTVIPKSACDTVREIHEAGHRTYILSGRSRGYIFDRTLLSLPFDGIVSDAGAMVEMDGQVLREYICPPGLLARTVQTAQRYDYLPLLEGNRFLYMDTELFRPTPYIAKLKRELKDRLRPVKSTWNDWPDVGKLTLVCERVPDAQPLMEALKDDWDFIVHNDALLELVPKGVNKGTGLRYVMDRLGLPVSRSVAIGDSMNDLHMLRAAGIGICMGNGEERLRREADYVTGALWDDGIAGAWAWLRATGFGGRA